MQLNKDRIAVLIGTNGSTKEMIEQETGTILEIDSEAYTCFVRVNKSAKPKDETEELVPEGMRKYITKYIVKAINHGFNPKKALKLTNEDKMLEVIDLEKILGSSPKKLKRIKGRIIGRDGKIRKQIEYFSGADISVYEKFIGIIGDFQEMKISKKAINMIIQGAPHYPVLNFLQEKYEIRKQEEFTKMWKPVI